MRRLSFTKARLHKWLLAACRGAAAPKEDGYFHLWLTANEAADLIASFERSTRDPLALVLRKALEEIEPGHFDQRAELREKHLARQPHGFLIGLYVFVKLLLWRPRPWRRKP